MFTDRIQTIFGYQQCLKKLAREVILEHQIHPTCPQPEILSYPAGVSFPIYTPDIKSTLWGPPEQLTLSLAKNDVHDRRAKFIKPFTLERTVAGAMAEVNEELIRDLPNGEGRIRANFGMLIPEGGREYPTAASIVYPFPCPKPVGQLQIRCPDMEGANQPMAKQYCSSGHVETTVENMNNASLKTDIQFSMNDSTLSLKLSYQHLNKPLEIRLYRHKDTAHLKYMNEDGTFIEREKRPKFRTYADDSQQPEYYNLEEDADWNGPIEAPSCGQEGRFFWIHQKFPAEKTFPDGFEYVMMGIAPEKSFGIECREGEYGLGTPAFDPINNRDFLPTKFSYGHQYELIKNALGAASTLRLALSGNGETQLYFVIVTSAEDKDVFTRAKERLLATERCGHEGIVKESTNWFDQLYDRRENGRVYLPEGIVAKKSLVAYTFYNWGIAHSGFIKTDARKYQASFHCSVMEVDIPYWHGIPCYNELFYTPTFVRNRSDMLDMWWQLVEHWMPALREKAKNMFNMPGLVILHGYLPPIKSDVYFSENLALEYCLCTAGQVANTLMGFWDYDADEELLLRVIQPFMTGLADFFEAYARRNLINGKYHIIPVMEPENWGIAPDFTYNKDSTSALAVCAWTLRNAIKLAKYTKRDMNHLSGWNEVVENLVSWPLWLTESGPIIAAIPNIKPRWSPGDHPWYCGLYPTTLTDDITLDSSLEDRELMLRTARTIQTLETNGIVFVLLGDCKNTTPSDYSLDGHNIDSYEELLKQIDSYPERLLNSRGERIHLFPCVPEWANIAFHNFQAKGGFLVSAARTEKGVFDLEITFRRNIPCSLVLPWQCSKVIVEDTVTGHSVLIECDAEQPDTIEFQMPIGHECRIMPSDIK